MADNLADNMTDNGLKFLAVGEGADQREIAERSHQWLRQLTAGPPAPLL